MERSLRVLVVEDSETDAALTVRALRRAGLELDYRRVDSAKTMAEALSQESFGLILSDYALPGFSLWEALQTYHSHACDAPFIVVSGVIGEDTAVKSMRMGAHDYVRKDDLRRLIPAVARELREAEVRRQKRLADRASRQSEEMLQLVMDGVPVMLAYVDSELCYRMVNREYAQWLGATPEEVAGRRVAGGGEGAGEEPIYADLASHVLAALDGRETDREVLLRSPVRGEHWVRVRCRPHEGADGVVGVFVVGTDVTEQRDARRELAAREAEVRSILDSTADGIVVIDERGRIETFNRAAERMFGYAATEAVGQNVSMLMRESERSEHDGYLEGYRCSGIARVLGCEREVVGRRKNGELFPTALRIAPRVDGQGTVTHFIGTVQDITERRALQVQREKLLERTQRAERLEALGTFAGGIAHDLNNILAPILMYSAVLEARGFRDRDQQNIVHDIRKATTRATQLVEQIVSFAAGELEDRGSVDISAVVREVVACQQAAHPGGVSILCEEAPELWIWGNASQLLQCVLNLVVNAVQALPSGGGRVTVRVRRERDVAAPRPPELLCADYHVIEVEDTGDGIDPPTQRRIFDPFFSTKRACKGSGLGLAIVHSIVRAHEGAITVDSTVGQGSTFRLYLPASRGEPRSLGCIGLEGVRVLFVDDDAAICAAATAVIEHSGMTVETFDSPWPALQCVEAEPDRFDVAIVDQHMPEISGVEVLERLRAIRPDLPVILGTGRLTASLESLVARLCDQPVLSKPYTADQLSRAIGAARAPRRGTTARSDPSP